MPLTSKGNEIMSALTKEYGADKGKQVFYAGKNSGKFTGVDENQTAEEKTDEVACRVDAMGERLKALVFDQPAQNVKDYAADDLNKLADVMTSGFPAPSVNDPGGRMVTQQTGAKGDSLARDDAQALINIAKRNGVKITVGR